MAREINLFDWKPIEAAVEEQHAFPDLVEKMDTFDDRKRQEKETRLHVKRLIEALLFAGSDPLPFNKIREVTDTLHPLKPKTLRELIEELGTEYISLKRGFRLEEIAQGYVLRSCSEYGKYIELLYRNRRTEKLSQASSEVLAIIAYRQPITRPQIDAIRGVDSSGSLQNLLERQLIEAKGKLEAPGRPTLYGTTPEFLKYYGLRDLSDLPRFQGKS